MTALALTNTITNGTPADASKVQTNFSDIQTYINGNVIRTDGTNPMVAALSTNNANPTTSAHAVRKAYMDGAIAIATTGTAQVFAATVWKTLVFATEVRDGTNGANTSTNYNLGTGVFTVPVAGLYLLCGGVFNSSMSDGALYNSRWSINAAATTFSGPSTIPNQNPFVDQSKSFTVSHYLALNDTVELQVKIASALTRTCGNYMMIAWLHA